MKRVLLGVSVSLLALSGCSHNWILSHGTELNTEISETNQMPEEKPNDFNFSLSYGYGDQNKNEINTYDKSVNKDLSIHGQATVEVSFSPDEMQRIYDKMKEINMMQIDEIKQQLGCSKVPSTTDSWKITINGETKTLSWTDEDCKVNSVEQQLLDLRTYIQQIVSTKDTFKALPEAVGGYD